MAIIAGVVGTVGVVNLSNTYKKYNDLYTDFGIALGDIADASIAYQQIRVSLRDILIVEDSTKQEQYVENIKKQNEVMQDALVKFEASLRTEEGKNDKLNHISRRQYKV